MPEPIEGQLAAVVIPGTGTLTLVYKCPAARKAIVNLDIANSADTVTSIKIVHIKNDIVANVAAEDYRLGGTGAGFPTNALGHNMANISDKGILLEAGDEIGVESSDVALAAQINGREEDV